MGLDRGHGPDRRARPRARPSSPPLEPTVYRLAPALAARFIGSALVGVALVMFLVTAVVAIAGLPPDLLAVPLVLGVVGVFVLGWWLRSRAWVLRLDAEGYAVRLVRGARTTDAAWADVVEVATTTLRGAPCVVLSLEGDRSTILPVQAVAHDRDDLVRELQRRLAAARR